jgi:hypothetical protein
MFIHTPAQILSVIAQPVDFALAIVMRIMRHLRGFPTSSHRCKVGTRHHGPPRPRPSPKRSKTNHRHEQGQVG